MDDYSVCRLPPLPLPFLLIVLGCCLAIVHLRHYVTLVNSVEGGGSFRSVMGQSFYKIFFCCGFVNLEINRKNRGDGMIASSSSLPLSGEGH